MYAIVQSGGHQYRVTEGEVIEVHRLDAADGDTVELREVLMVGGSPKVRLGTPYIDGAVVRTTVVGERLGRKITVFKYKPKNRYRVKTGHRQQYTRLHIDAIEA